MEPPRVVPQYRVLPGTPMLSKATNLLQQLLDDHPRLSSRLQNIESLSEGIKRITGSGNEHVINLLEQRFADVVKLLTVNFEQQQQRYDFNVKAFQALRLQQDELRGIIEGEQASARTQHQLHAEKQQDLAIQELRTQMNRLQDHQSQHHINQLQRDMALGELRAQVDQSNKREEAFVREMKISHARSEVGSDHNPENFKVRRSGRVRRVPKK